MRSCPLLQCATSTYCVRCDGPRDIEAPLPDDDIWRPLQEARDADEATGMYQDVS
jgi:hypothetical protein